MSFEPDLELYLRNRKDTSPGRVIKYENKSVTLWQQNISENSFSVVMFLKKILQTE